MNKTELVDAVAESSGVSKADVDRVLKALEETIQETVANGDGKVTIPGFVSFELTHRAARTARNPRTGEPLDIPAQRAVKVSAGARLKSVVKASG
jgi:DNA-binding protein HU-beta